MNQQFNITIRPKPSSGTVRSLHGTTTGRQQFFSCSPVRTANTIVKMIEAPADVQPAQHWLVNETQEAPLAQQFRRLAEEWRKKKAGISSIKHISMLREYQKIMAMGPSVVPLILDELQKEPDHWFWALNFLTEADPVPEQDRGDLDRMADAWVRWGKKEHLIS